MASLRPDAASGGFLSEKGPARVKNGLSILLVEDIITLADAMKGVLEDDGFLVTVANSGTQAAAILDSAHIGFDFLITDLNIGAGPSGWDVARDARAKSHKIPIIYLTGEDSQEFKCTEPPKSLIMQKPVSARALSSAVEGFADRLLSHHKDCLSERVEELLFRLGESEGRAGRVAKIADESALRQAAANRDGEIAIAATDLAASKKVLSALRKRAKLHRAELRESGVALALSRDETKIGLVDLLASAAALETSRAETKISLADLVVSAAALADSRGEALASQMNLLDSEKINRDLHVANGLLVTNEAALTKIVEQRTLELTSEVEGRRITEEALHQSEKLRALGQLTGGIAHDFNNILQLVFSTTAFLKSPNLEDERRLELLQGLEDAAALAGQVTSRLLAFARKKVLAPQRCDLNAVLTGMHELLIPMLGPNVSLEADLAAHLWPVIVDKSQLEVAILNIASNARDAMRRNGGVFRISTNNVVPRSDLGEPTGEQVCLTFSDTGTGMPAEVVAQAFEPFFTTKPLGAGTGLGLAQVWGFMKQSQGTTSIAASEGGTSLHLCFPRASEEARSIRGDNEVGIVTETYDVRASRQTVLVVEDNADLASLTKSLLQQMGYRTLSAENASAALAILDTDTSVDAVFSDIVMPGEMNGVQLAELLYMKYPQLPVTLATGYSEYLITHPVPKSVEVLAKPYRVNELRHAIRRSFAQKRQIS